MKSNNDVQKFQVVTREQAIQAARIGAFTTFGVGGLYVVVFLYALGTNATEGQLSAFNDPANILDVIIAAVCGFALLRQSRAAAVVIFIWFVLGKVTQFVLFPSTAGGVSLFLAVAILFLVGRAIQGTFKFHKLEKEHNPDYRSPSKWTYILGIPAGLIGLVLCVYALLSTTDFFPSTKVVSGQELSVSDTFLLINNSIVLPNENIEYFYSEGLLSIKEGGSVLTDKRIIAYWQEDGTIQIESIAFSEISNIELIEEGNYLNNSVHKVFGNKDHWLLLILSTEKQGDIEFINALRQKVGD